MENIVNIIQIVLAVILITVVLLQNRGSGMGMIMGGGGGNVYRTKRGFDKVLFISTIVISVLFFGVALANLLIRQ